MAKKIKQYRSSIVEVVETLDAYGNVIRKPVGERRGRKGVLTYLLQALLNDIASGKITDKHDVTIVPATRRMPWEVPEEAGEDEDKD